MRTTLPELTEKEKQYIRRSKTFKDYYIDLSAFIYKSLPKIARTEDNVSDELKKAIKFLDWNLTTLQVINFSRWTMILSLIFLLLINLGMYLTGYLSYIALMFSLIIPYFLGYYVTSYPKNEARFARIEAIGQAPNVLTQIVIYLKQNPNLEKALHFVSKYSQGRMVNDFKKTLWGSLMGHKKNLKVEMGKLADRWGESLIEIKRSIYLIIASTSEKNEIKRNQSLDRAISISLEGIIAKIKEYTVGLHLPTLFLFSFGTVLPLVIISLLPIFAFFGKELSSPFQILMLLMISLVGIYIYSNKIIASKPPTFSSINLPEYHKAYPTAGNLKFKVFNKEFEINALYYPIGVFLAISFPGVLFLISRLPWINMQPNMFGDVLKGINTLTIIWAFGIALAIYAFGSSWYKKKLRDHVESLEKEMIDGTYQLASRIGEGRSPESAIKDTSISMPGTKFGDFMKETHRIIRARHTTIEEAMFNPSFGSLKDIHSDNFKSVMRIFVNSIKKGTQTCSQTLFTMSDHFDKLKKTEDKLKETLKNSLSMMKTTASFFAPMITGLIITLQQLIQDGLAESQSRIGDIGYEVLSLSFLQAPSFSVEMLQLITGIYMLLLAILLIRYVSLLEHGKEGVMLKMELAKSIPIALFIFTFTLIFSRIILA